MIETAQPQWSQDQREAIINTIQLAFAQLHSQDILDDDFVAALWPQLSSQFQPSATTTTGKQPDISVLSYPKDVRFQLLLELLAVILDLKTDSQDAKKIDMTYDSRARTVCLEVAKQVGLGENDLEMAERSVSQEIYFKLEEKGGGETDRKTDEMGDRANMAIEDASKKNQAWRWVKMGAGAAVGGTVIALTGGLAAPLVAPLVVGLTGATFFTTAGGIALMTSLFGLTGGGLTGWKMHRRTRGIDDFHFEQLVNPDVPHIPSIHCTICISGYLLDDASVCITPWDKAFEKVKIYRDIYCISYEKVALLNLGRAFKTFIRNEAFKYAGKEALKMTALQAFFAAVALPATILKAADVIDNPWQIAADRSMKAGLVLADVLQERVHGKRPVTLVSVKSAAQSQVREFVDAEIFPCIWHQPGAMGKDVFCGKRTFCELLFAQRLGSRYVTISWIILFILQTFMLNVPVFGIDRSLGDANLATVFRLHSMSTEVAGLSPIKNVPRIENIQVDVEGHTSYSDNVSDILSHVQLV
ncbi:hypothetical protein INT43_000127 [Umbelopsis isabellina]|uniref:Uncharacterized protein n=1 Tax=Mortierella isabellina TaxID=91625 RepID=A0A8H7PFL4_MORIS|nr:hypothetical protein INT43_000127 [Umbelopsis isabellina]